MKLEIKEHEEGYELRQIRDDGSLQVWGFKEAPALMLKLAQFLYEEEAPPKRRSILAGEFVKKRKKAEKEKESEKTFKDLMGKIQKSLEKDGFAPAEEQPQQPAVVPFITQPGITSPTIVPWDGAGTAAPINPNWITTTGGVGGSIGGATGGALGGGGSGISIDNTSGVGGSANSALYLGNFTASASNLALTSMTVNVDAGSTYLDIKPEL